MNATREGYDTFVYAVKIIFTTDHSNNTSMSRMPTITEDHIFRLKLTEEDFVNINL